MLEPAEATGNADSASLALGSRPILASAAVLGGLTIVAKVVAFGKDLLVARTFGAGDDLDAYLVAFLVPSFGVTVLASSFAPAFMPTYIRLLHEQGAGAARGLAGRALLGTLGLLVGLTAMLVVAGPWILRAIGSGFDTEKLALAQSLLYIVAGVLIASGLSAVFTTILHAHDQFAMASLAPVVVPAATVALLWALQDRLGIYALAVGTLVGFAVELAALAVATRASGLLPRVAWQGVDSNLRHVASRYVPMAIGSLLISSSVVVDQSMAASLGSGNVSVLSYGNKVVAFLLSLVAVSLSSALFPRFSRMITLGERAPLRRTLRTYSLAVLALSIPGVAAVAWFAEPMIRLLFERGAFTREDTIAAAVVQGYLAVQIPFYILVMIGFRLLSALDGYGIILRIGALNLVLNIAGNLALMPYLGVAGIALSTSLVYVVAAVVTFAAIRFKMAVGQGASD
jgi:putative peptidoglycan lipid II flippase